MKKLLILLPVLLLFSCSKEKISIPSDAVVKVRCFAEDIEEGEAINVDITYKLDDQDEKTESLEMSVYQGVLKTEVGIGQLVNLETLFIKYETSDQVKIWHRISNMDESDIYVETSSTDLNNTSIEYDYNF